jgi:N-acyl-D-aspartate/D-glutamate deacylase
LSEARPLLAQGVTTVFVNPDGGGAVDLPGQRRALKADGLGVNVAQMVPHGAIRRDVIGMEDRVATPQELEEMRVLVRTGMEAGAFGLSTGLFYAPASYAGTDEVIALAEVAAAFGGVHSSHIRDESDYSIGLIGAVEEVIAVSRATGIPGVVTHIKALGPRVWGQSGAVIGLIESARAGGVEVWADQYPYPASATGLTAALFPRWAQAGGGGALRQRLEDPDERARLRAAVLENLDRRGGAGRLRFRYYAPDASIEGRSLQEVADARGEDVVDVVFDLAGAGSAGVVSFNMREDDIAAFMRQPWTMTASDGALVPPGEGVPHPRAYGTFPRKIRTYVFEEGVITLEAAIRSMTGMPAAVYRIRARGLLQAGHYADLVVFDAARLRDAATFQEPHQYAEGMAYVFVNGRAAIDEGRFTGALSGRVLTRDTP